MCPLDDVLIIGHAHAVLPIVGVSIRQLIELTLRLITDVIHALEVGNHPIFLETNCHKLGIVGVQLGTNLKCSL
jgi:hypothetical protein